MTQQVRHRLIVELCHGASDPTTLRVAAEFARMLGLDLHALFIEDEALIAWSETSSMRELRLPTYEWSALTGDTVGTAWRHQATRSHQQLERCVAGIASVCAFDVLRGDPATCIAGVCHTGDVVLVCEPAGAVTHGATRLRFGAQASVASVLLLPHRPVESGGSIGVVLADADDPSLEIASRLALSAGARLLVLIPTADKAARTRLLTRANAIGLPADRMSLYSLSRRSAADIAAACAGQRLRMLLTSESQPDDAKLAAALVATGNVPVLLLAPTHADNTPTA